MITAFILNLFFGFLNFLFSFLPNITTIPETFTDMINYASSFIGNLAWVFPPIATMLTIFGLIISIEIAIAIWKVSDYIYNKVRGSG